MWLEIISPNEELRKDVMEIAESTHTSDAEKNLAEKGRMLRDLRSKWEGKVTKAFMDHVNNMIKLTDKIPEGMPILPNAKAYNFKDDDQVKEYVSKVEKTYNDIIDWAQRKRNYAVMSPSELSPEDRYAKLVKGIKRMVEWVKEIKSRNVIMPSGVITLMDSGEWPGHVVGKIKFEDVDRAKMLASLNYLADQVAFKYYKILPVVGKLKGLEKQKYLEKAEKEIEHETAVLKAKLLTLTREELFKVADDEGIKYPKRINKEELVDKILGGKK